MYKTITIGFSKPKNRLFPIGSWLIRLYEGTEFSHVYLKFQSDTLDRELVYEAVGSGIRFVGSNVWQNHAEEVNSYSIQIKNVNYINLIQYCVDNAGTDYGFMQNIGILISNLLKLNKNIFRKGKNCSEVVAEILMLEGYKLNKSKDLITPKDIYLVLKNNNLIL